MSDRALSAEMDNAQRERLFEGILNDLGDGGYEAIDLEDVLSRTGMSRDEFETAFADMDACLFAAYEHLTSRLVEKTTERCDSDLAWQERVRQGLESLLQEVARNPRRARVVMRSFPAIHPSAHVLYTTFLASLASALREGRDLAEAEDLPAQIEILAVGAGEAIIFDELEAGRAAELPDLLPAILFSVIVPFVGPDAASVAMWDAKRAG